MEGIIDYLTEDSFEANFLRSNLVFKVFPMVNVDGVVHGNNRCSLAGVDLNRRWRSPSQVFIFHSPSFFIPKVKISKKLHPCIYNIKNAIKQFASVRETKLVIDLHGHSKKYIFILKKVYIYS